MKYRYNYSYYEDGKWWVPTIQDNDVTRYDPELQTHRALRFKTEKAVKAYINRIIANQDSYYKWQTIWRAAYANMPVRLGQSKTVYWVPVDKSVSVPDFIKGSAKKRMKMENGEVLEKTVEVQHFQYGRYACLARLLGYKVKNQRTGRVTPHGLLIYTNCCRGSKPADPAKQRLLRRLAGENGTKLARKMLTELGIVHRYNFEVRRNKP